MEGGSTIVVAVRVPVTTRTLIEAVALEQATTKNAWMKATLRRVALEQLMSGSDRPAGKVEAIPA